MPAISHPTLQQDCVQSAQLLLDYMLAHKNEGKGMFSAQVRSVQGTLLNTDLVLNIDRKIRSGDGIMIRIGGTIYENKEGMTCFLVQSAEKRQVVISPMPELAAHIQEAQETKEKIFVEVDLTFLVKRVKEWYEKHGGEVHIPIARPKLRLNPENPIELSENQLDCANTAMTAPLSYIGGAPGTGKTKHVLASCIYSYIQAGKKVLLLAPTNTALEQSLSGLLRALADVGFNPDGKVYRMGVPSDRFRANWPNLCGQGIINYIRMEIDERISWLKYENGMIDASMEVRSGKAEKDTEDRYPQMDLAALAKKKKENTDEINDLLKQSRKISEGKSMEPLLMRLNVIAATVDACIHWIPPDGAFRPDHVFLDEAGYCSVIKGMTLTGFDCPVTMLGDHMQLPPVFDCEDEQLKRDPETRIIKLWEISTLYNEDVIYSDDRSQLCAYKLLRKPQFDHTATGALTETYRFGPALANVLAKIYQGRFQSRSDNETKILYVNAPKPEQDKGKDEHGEYKRISHTESRCIRDIVEHNLSRMGSIGIITPYKYQRLLTEGYIHRLLKKYEITEDMDDDILTVHRSQGREWDIVLFSMTDCYDEKFYTNSSRLESLKLINTAVSRAKKLLILIGDADSWKPHREQLITNLLQVAQECGTEIRFEDYTTTES